MKAKPVRSSRSSTEIRFVYKQKRPTVKDFEADAKKVTVRYEGRTTIVYAGLGEKKDLTPAIIRSAAAAAVRAVADLKRDTVALVLTDLADSHDAAVEGALLGSYAFTKYLSEKPHAVKSLDVVSDQLSTADVRRLQTAAEGVALARDLVNDNANVKHPEHLASVARDIGKSAAVNVSVLDEKQLRRQGLNLLHAVGQGAPYPPRLIVMDYRGAPRSKAVTAIVGKGITFDSGGMNLKPSGHIETMRQDMAGAAAVLGTMKAIARIKPPINVVGVCAAAYNAIDGKASIPGDILTSYSGKTVEICNTDAEGRLALADAISYVQAKRQPTEIIDLATLTGGMMITFADLISGLFSNDDRLATELFSAGEQTNERLWRLPVYAEFSEAMKSDRCDLRNLPKFKRGHASSVTGAAFIKEFVQDIPWAHLDIAGTAFNDGEARGEIPKYGTGFGVRLLLRYLLEKSV